MIHVFSKWKCIFVLPELQWFLNTNAIPSHNLPNVLWDLHVINLNHNLLGIFSNFPEFIHIVWPSQQLDKILIVGDDHQLEVFLTGSRLDNSIQQIEAIGNIPYDKSIMSIIAQFSNFKHTSNIPRYIKPKICVYFIYLLSHWFWTLENTWLSLNDALKKLYVNEFHKYLPRITVCQTTCICTVNISKYNLFLITKSGMECLYLIHIKNPDII